MRDVVLPYEGTDCVTWPFATDNDGYGKFFADGQQVGAARYVCEIVNGPAPTAGHEAAHSCGNGHLGCVTKRHIRWATTQENADDKQTHGTAPKGERNPSAKLTEEDVRRIRKIGSTRPQASIAEEFGVSQPLIGMILRGEIWSSVV